MLKKLDYHEKPANVRRIIDIIKTEGGNPPGVGDAPQVTAERTLRPST